MDSNHIDKIYNVIPKLREDSWIHNWEVRSKLITLTIYVFGLVCLSNPILLVFNYLILTIILYSIGMKTLDIVKKTIGVLPLLIVLSVPILLGGGFPIDNSRLELALNISLKAINSISIMFIMFFTQDTNTLFNSLGNMKVPKALISILFLTWRYLFLLIENFAQLNKALKSRLFRPKLNKNIFKVYSSIMGGMIIKSIDTSENVYKAMESRGYKGELYISRGEDIGKIDILKSSVFLILIVFLNSLEKWC